MREMLGWLPCRIRCRHDSSRSATPFTTTASRAGFKIKHALALRWMRNVPGSLPQSVDLPNLMLACRRAAEVQGIEPIGEVARFNQLFIIGVRKKGLSDEAVLAMRFNLTTGHFLQDALSAPKMVVRGMIGPTSKEQANADEVKELIDRARMAASQNTPSPEKEA